MIVSDVWLFWIVMENVLLVLTVKVKLFNKENAVSSNRTKTRRVKTCFKKQ